MNRRIWRTLILAIGVMLIHSYLPATLLGGVVFRGEFLEEEFIWRWDGALRTHDVEGEIIERSLVGGLRYSLEGGSFLAFRDSFSWQGGPPDLTDFTQAIHDAFAAWTSTDPVTGLPTLLSFTEDLGTMVSDEATPDFINLGAEIDIFSDDFGHGARSGFASVFAQGLTVELTSGVVDYPSFAISGADIFINGNPGAQYTLEGFRNLLVHELGHALGLADLEVADMEPVFIDDNYDGSSSATALATLTDSWARRVNPLDPDNLTGSGLELYQVANGDPGLDTEGVRILMESEGSIELIGVLNPLQNDDYGTRQFLYPLIPAPDPDFNLDGVVDETDVDMLVAEIATPGANSTLFDMDGNGTVNGDDLIAWLAAAGAENLNSGNSYLVGDANLDAVVDGFDLFRWNANKFQLNAAWTAGDFNADGIVDGLDFDLWNANKFQSAELIPAVPEPAISTSFALAFVCFCLACRVWR